MLAFLEMSVLNFFGPLFNLALYAMAYQIYHIYLRISRTFLYLKISPKMGLRLILEAMLNDLLKLLILTKTRDCHICLLLHRYALTQLMLSSHNNRFINSNHVQLARCVKKHNVHDTMNGHCFLNEIHLGS